MQVELCPPTDIPDGSMKRFELMGYDILAIHLGGRFFALDAWCTYRYADLQGARIDAARMVLVCPECQGSWDIETGQPKDSPVTFPLTTYPIEVAGDQLVLTFIY